MADFLDRSLNYSQLYRNETINPKQDANENHNSTFNDFNQLNVPLPLMSVKYSFISIILFA